MVAGIFGAPTGCHLWNYPVKVMQLPWMTGARRLLLAADQSFAYDQCMPKHPIPGALVASVLPSTVESCVVVGGPK